MNKTTIVAFLILLSNQTFAINLSPEITAIEQQWAQMYYAKSNLEQKRGYPILLDKTRHLLVNHPKNAELMIWHAIITSTNAAHETPFIALESINNAKKQLEQAIQINPNALEGAAFVALGTLYYMTPGWPISFGSDNKAEKLLKKALEINPSSIDSNYFYADYLLTQNKINEAYRYFKLALTAPTRAEQRFADQQLKIEALNALRLTKQKKHGSVKQKFLSLFISANSE